MANNEKKKRLSVIELLVVGAASVALWETAKSFAIKDRRRPSREDLELAELEGL